MSGSAIDPNRDYILTAPVQYINRPNVLDECGKFISQWGQKVLVSGGKRALNAVEDKLFPALDRAAVVWEKSLFTGECCDENIALIIEKARRTKADAIVGVGGGKALDSAKAAAEHCGLPIICIPTIAATCAAASALSVMYTPVGVHQQDFYLTKNPNLVLVDPQIIAHAPVEYFESGILDSLSKWYEGRTAFKRIERPDVFTVSAIKLSALLNEIMEKEAVSAVAAVKNKQGSSSVMAITDLNIYLAAIIQSISKTTRGAAAHCIHSGLSVIPESHRILHGFKVGYGMIVQLFMEDAPLDEIRKVIHFFRQLDLEPTLKGLNLPFTPVLIKQVAEKSLLGDTMKYMPFEVEAAMVIAAMEKAEREVGNL